MADPIANSVSAKVVENLVDRILNFILNPISDRITVVRKCNENVENLKNQVEKLKTEMEHVENYKKKVGRRGEVIGDTVQTWLTNAQEFIEATEESVRVGDEFAKKECFFRLCPNPIPRYKLSKQAEKNSEDIIQHLDVARGFGPLPLSHAPPPQQDVAALMVVEGFEEFRSRKIVLDQIMDALRSPTVNRIGLHGTSGMGKTMLVKMVKAKAKQDSLFSVVVMATVTKGRDLKNIQEDIARDLGFDQLSFREHTEREVADLIKAKLMKERKFLVILDDVWDTEIDFEKFGIPSAGEMKQGMEKKKDKSSSRQEDMLCKILLTSRVHNNLFAMMGEKDQVFEVHKLQDDEAWHLFKKIVGSNAESSNFQPIAREMVERCIGLPVAIASVGKAMRRKTKQFEWEAALTGLKKASPEGISVAVYKPIELSYNYLQGEELKKTFILCSLLGRNSSIDDLLKCGMGLDLFQNVNTIEETRAKVLRLVSRLKMSSLLVDGDSSLHFDVSDQIREVALSIAFRDHSGLALVDEVATKKLEDKETLEKLKWISLPNGDIELPANGLQCPQLTFFYLSNKAQSQKVPSEFLRRADGLKVLCMTKIDFKSTPSPIPFIPMNVCSLLLDQCVFKVEDLGAIAGNLENLENLEVLSLTGCDIEELPREMENLTKLKLLDMSDCTNLKVIPRQVLARLSKLEELKMGNSFDQWDVERGNASLAELTELRMLTALEVRIPNFQETLLLENLERFKIFIGIVSRKNSWDRWYDYSWDSNSWNSSFESSNIMKLKLQGARIKSNDSVKKLLKKTEELYLEGLNGVESLVDELDDEGFQHLKCLHVQNAPDIRCIFNTAGRLLLSQVFPILEVLTLTNLEKMEKICHGLTGAAPFKVLRKITVVDCHQLKNLFSFSMARQLQLEEITVVRCNNIEEIIDDVEEQGSGNDIVEESEGCKLGSLRSFNEQVGYSQLGKLHSSSVLENLEAITVHFCETLISLSTSTVHFRTLITLEVSHCKWMINLISISTAQSLENLRSMIVSYCHKLTEIVGNEGDGAQASINFPKLTYLKLEGLTKLASFCSGNSNFKFPSLKQVIVNQCPQLMKFCRGDKPETPLLKRVQLIAGGDKWRWAGNLNKTIQQMYIEKDGYAGLQNLILSDFPEVMESWHRKSPQEMLHFKLIQDLKICGCSNFKCLLTASLALAFVQLKKLAVINCGTMEQVIVGEGPENQIIFPYLWLIILESCSDMTSFYVGSQNLRIPELLHIYLKDCPKILTFAASTLLGGHEKEAFQYFFSSEVEIPRLDTLDLCSINVQKIWHDELSSMSSLVQNLRKLTVRDSGNLKYLFTSIVVKSFVQLEVLEIFECQLMEVVILIEDREDEKRVHQMAFPKLNVLELMVLPQFKKFCGTCNSLVEISEPQGLLNGSGSQVLSPTG